MNIFSDIPVLGEYYDQARIYLKAKFVLKKKPSKPRVIPINHILTSTTTTTIESSEKPEKYPTNHINTAKYNIISFIPKNLIEQFTRMANLLFLFIMILQLATGLSPTGRFGYLIALTPLILGQMLKDGVEDALRHWSDRSTNRQKVKVFNRETGQFVLKRWMQITVGDIVLVNNDEIIPADMVVLFSQSPPDAEGKCYVETSQLDGETNLKQKMSLHLTQKRCIDEAQLMTLSATIECDQPSKALYSFNGTFTLIPKLDLEDPEKSPILYDNLLLRGTKLKNSQYIYGLTVYTGKHTKILMNGRSLPNKRSKVESMINLMVILLFLCQTAFAIICAISSSVMGERSDGIWYLSSLFELPKKKNVVKNLYEGVVLYFLLFNNFVPIGLLASLEFVKVVYARVFIDRDQEMICEETGIGATANNSQIPEELGQIKMVFSDKTGTLTKNIMKFKKFWIPNNIRYGTYETPIAKKTKGFYDERVVAGNWRRQPNTNMFFDFFMILALCHTVTPENKNGKLVYEASSPDELTLVQYAAEMGFKVVARTENTISLELYDDESESVKIVQFLILNVLHFNSDRKRMSVIVRVLDDIGAFRELFPLGQIFLLSKGADEVMGTRVIRTDLAHYLVDDALNDFGDEGLRTLMLGKRELLEEDYFLWNSEHYQPANFATERRQELIDAAAELIENDLDMTGVTAIEDELQNDVAHTIEQLRKAGIQVYMLTGDKQETAVTIGKSCALIDDSMKLIFITLDDMGLSAPRENFLKLKAKIEGELQKVVFEEDKQNDTRDYAIITNGNTLDLMFETYADISIEQVKLQVHSTFMNLCLRCKSVICARTSPSQKAKIVILAQKYVRNARTLSIGDGSNDIPMIQSAHVGVGIRGKEGLQASRAADFAIGEFKFLERLLLIHGKNNYRRIAKLILHTMYKNVANQTVQFYFAFFSRFSGMSVHMGVALLLFNLLFATIPMFLHAIFDKEVSDKKSLAFPELYREGQRDTYINFKVVLMWVVNGFYHGAVCYFLVFAFFCTGDPIDHHGMPLDFFYFGMIVSTSVIMVVTYKAMLEMYTYNLISILGLISTIPIWFIFLFAWCSILKLAKMNYWMVFIVAKSPAFWLATFVTSVAAILWDFAWKSLVRILPWTRTLYHCVQEIPDNLSVEQMRLVAATQFNLKEYATEKSVCDPYYNE